MSKTILLNQSDWHFTKENPGIPTAVMGEAVTLPHTWNAVDGQDGGNDYYRGTCWYTLALAKPTIPAGGKAVLQLDGAAMTAAVYLNGEKLAEHKGGYSTFRVDLTDHLKEENLLAISVDNSDNDTVYPPESRFYLLRRHLPRCYAAYCTCCSLCPCRKRRGAHQGYARCDRPCRASL